MPPQCHYFQANLPFSMHDLPLFPKSVLSFSISHVCCLDGHNLPRSKKPCLCLSCQVISSHSAAILPIQFCWQHFPCFIPLPSMFQLRVSLHTKPNPTAEQDWTCQEDEAGQHWVTANSILFHSILLQGLGAPLATLTPTQCTEREATNSFILLFLWKIKKFCLFFTLENNKSSGDDALLWHMLGSHADWYRQEQQASPEHMCKYSRIANTKDKHSWTKQLCWREGNVCKWCFAVLPALMSPLYSITWSFTQTNLSDEGHAPPALLEGLKRGF